MSTKRHNSKYLGISLTDILAAKEAHEKERAESLDRDLYVPEKKLRAIIRRNDPWLKMVKRHEYPTTI